MKRPSNIVFLFIVGMVIFSGVGASATPFLVYAQDDVEPPTGGEIPIAEAVFTGTVGTGAVGIDTMGIDTMGIDTGGTEAVDTEAVDTEAVDTEAVDTEAVDTKVVDTEAVGTDTLGLKTILSGFEQHPQIIAVRHHSEYNYETREFEQIVAVDIVIDGWRREMAGTVTFLSREWPYEQWQVQLPRRIARRRRDHNQLLTFTNYTTSVLSCRWQEKAAHVYDNPATWNPAGQLTVQAYAWALFEAMHDPNWQRVDCGAHAQDPPPPINVPPPQPVCEPTAAPHIDDLEQEGNTLFYSYIELSDGNTNVQLGFGHSGDSWQLIEQNGDVSGGDCQEQLNTFVNYTLAILTSPTCTAVPVYSPAEEAVIAGYVQAVGNFCGGGGP